MLRPMEPILPPPSRAPGVLRRGLLAAGPVRVIAVAQLLATSLWFSANSAADDLMRDWGASASDIGRAGPS